MLNTKIANEIVNETSVRVNRNINIMNTKGIIISSIDKKRLGTIHQGAIEVLKTKKNLSVYSQQKWKGTQPGINLPIKFMGEIIGVIGITGVPDELENIGELVKMTTELMIKQNYLELQTEWKQHTREVLIDQLLKKEPSISIIEKNKNLLGLNLKPPFISILIRISEREISNRKITQLIEENINVSQSIIGFINVNDLIITFSDTSGKEANHQIENLYKLLKDLNVQFRMSKSLPFSQLIQFDKAYNECEITMKISNPTVDFVSFSMLESKSLIYQIEDTIAERFSNRVLQNIDEQQISTLESFFSNNLNIQKTSEETFIHRNTLIYRLDKIIETTGYNPKNFEEALILQIAIWIFRK